MTSDRSVLDEAVVDVYLRPDAYYLSEKARTTVGLWVPSGTPATTLDLSVDADELGAALIRLLRNVARQVPHPAQDQWSEQRRTSLGPLIAQAGVRSWRAFEKDAAPVHVDRLGSRYTITPNMRDARRRDVWAPDEKRELDLEEPDCSTLGSAVNSALHHS